jgi:SAM-dependent methyltransferase
MQDTLKVLLNTSVLREIHGAMRRYGWRFPWLAARWAYYRCGDIWHELRFDRRLGVRTGFIVSAEDLGFADREAQNAAVRYRPTPPFTIRQGLQLLQRCTSLDFSTSAFVDYGCGAGRVLFIAAEAGFGALIGVEMSPQLVLTCRANVERYGRCRDIAHFEIVEGNAADYVPPATARVFFFFVPFGAEIYRAVVDRIRESVARDPRPIYVVDIGSKMKDFDFTRHGYRRIGAIEKLSIYEYAPE